MIVSDFGYDGIPQFTDGGNFNDHVVAGPEKAGWLAHEADARRRAGGYDVARFESKDAGEEGNQVGDLEAQVASVGVLQAFAVDLDADVQVVRVRNLVGRHDPGAHGRKGIERFSHQPLGGGALVVAGAYIIDDGVTEDVAGPILRLDMTASDANNKGELGFIVGGVRYLGQNDVVAGSNHRGGELIEDGRDFRNFGVSFLRVVQVVESNADQLLRPGDGGQQFDSIQRMRGWRSG